MDLGLETIRTKGRAAKASPPIGSRVVTSEEVQTVLTREQGIEAAPLARLTIRHRRLAELLAMGHKPSVAADLVGYDPSRVSILLADSTFKDLVHRFKLEYEDALKAQARDLHERLQDISLEAADALLERIENERDDLSVDDLRKLLELAADRTGYGPKRTEEKHVNVNIGARLEEARKRVLLAAKTIEGEVISQAAE